MQVDIQMLLIVLIYVVACVISYSFGIKNGYDDGLYVGYNGGYEDGLRVGARRAIERLKEDVDGLRRRVREDADANDV